jgi:thiamine-monophosphate kinase
MDDRKLLSAIRGLVGEAETADDCACYDLGDGRMLVSSTDMLHETTDFPPGMTGWEMGWMSVAVSLSDIAGCGAQPVQVLAAVGLDRPERLFPLMEGAVFCAEAFGAKISGGDIDSHRELTVVTTAFGIVEKAFYTRRGGAAIGDSVCITGVPGRAQAALDGFAEYRQHLITPEPQVALGRKLAESGVSAMMDVSDGLALSLYDMGRAGGTGFSLDSALFPLLPFENEVAMRYFLFGGGDFGLLCTVPPEKLDKLPEGVRVIGKVTEDTGILCDGDVLPERGYVHVWGE